MAVETKTVRPRVTYIGRSKETAHLYALEEKRGEILRQTATEWQRYMAEARGGDQPDFWNEVMPQQLYDTLEHYATGSIAACIAFLEDNGYVVTEATRS